MSEKEYITAEALGTVTSVIRVLQNLVPESLKHIIKEGETKKVLGTLYDWQERIFDNIKTTEDE